MGHEGSNERASVNVRRGGCAFRLNKHFLFVLFLTLSLLLLLLLLFFFFFFFFLGGGGKSPYANTRLGCWTLTIGALSNETNGSYIDTYMTQVWRESIHQFLIYCNIEAITWNFISLPF